MRKGGRLTKNLMWTPPSKTIHSLAFGGHSKGDRQLGQADDIRIEHRPRARTRAGTNSKGVGLGGRGPRSDTVRAGPAAGGGGVPRRRHAVSGRGPGRYGGARARRRRRGRK